MYVFEVFLGQGGELALAHQARTGVQTTPIVLDSASRGAQLVGLAACKALWSQVFAALLMQVSARSTALAGAGGKCRVPGPWLSPAESICF